MSEQPATPSPPEAPTSGNRRRILLTEGVFSMDGTVAPLKDLKAVADSHDALLVVDDAHGFGVLGHQGRGTLDSFDLKPEANVLMMGTLGKAIGSFGAFVAGDEDWIEQVIQFGRTYIYTTALPPHVIAASLAAMDVIHSEPNRISRLHDNVAFFRESFLKHAPDDSFRQRLTISTTPIQPVLVGDSHVAIEAGRVLSEAGFLVSAIRPPTVPEGTARLRITLSAKHQREQIQRLVSVLCGDEMVQLLSRSSNPSDGEAE